MKYLKMLGLAAVAAMALMAFVGASTASATTLTVTGVKQTGAVAIEASLKSGTSLILKDKNGTTTDTCTGSTIEGTTSTFTAANVTARVNTLDFSGCSHTTHVLASGGLWVAHTSGSNGTVSSSGAKVTVVSTVFGATATCETGAGTTIGTLTGVSSGNATIHINATTLNCGIMGTSSWTGVYNVTSPHGLGVTS